MTASGLTISGYYLYISGVICTNNNFYDLRYVKKLNQISEFQAIIINASGALASGIYETAPVIIYDENANLVLQGKIRKKEFNDELDEYKITGNDDSIILYDRIYPVRQQLDNQDPVYIASLLVSGIMVIGSTQVSGYFAPISFRIEHDSILRAVASLAKITDADWWISPSASGTPQLNFVDNRGLTTTAESFYLGDDVFEVERQNRVYDTWNAIRVFGYGDGINQKQSYIYHTTATQRGTLASNLLSGATVMAISGIISQFNNSGILRCGIEEMNYTSRNTSGYFAGLSRGTNTTTRYLHNKGIEVYDIKQYPITAPTSAQVSSSIKRWGLKENAYTDRAIRDQNTLDLLAQRLLTKYRNPTERIKITVAKQYLVSADIGDYVSLYDRT